MHHLCRVIDIEKEESDRDRETEKEKKNGCILFFLWIVPLSPLKVNESGAVRNSGFPLTYAPHIMETRSSAKGGPHPNTSQTWREIFLVRKDLNATKMSPRLAVYSLWEIPRKQNYEKRKWSQEAIKKMTKEPKNSQNIVMFTTKWFRLLSSISSRSLSTWVFNLNVSNKKFMKLMLASRCGSEDAEGEAGSPSLPLSLGGRHESNQDEVRKTKSGHTGISST